MVEQLQELNDNIKKLHSNNEISREECSKKNDAALKSLIKHITPTLSDDKVCEMVFFEHNFFKSTNKLLSSFEIRFGLIINIYLYMKFCFTPFSN